MFSCFTSLEQMEAMCKKIDMLDSNKSYNCKNDLTGQCGAIYKKTLLNNENKSIEVKTKNDGLYDEKKFEEGITSAEETTESSSNFLRKSRKPSRTVFSNRQLELLELEYMNNKYLSTNQRKNLSLRLHLAEGTVKVWFQNRRMKEKREQSEVKLQYYHQVMQSYLNELFTHMGNGFPNIQKNLPLQVKKDYFKDERHEFDYLVEKIKSTQCPESKNNQKCFSLTRHSVTSPFASNQTYSSTKKLEENSDSDNLSLSKKMFRPYAL